MALSKIKTNSLADDAVTQAKIADNAVTAQMISDGTIAAADLASSAVTNAKLSANAVTNVKVDASAAIAASKLDLSTITGPISITRASGIATTINRSGSAGTSLKVETGNVDITAGTLTMNGSTVIANNRAITATAITATGAFTSQGIDDNADATAITITSDEKVGFGTSSPFGRIHAKQHSVSYGIVVEANGNDSWLRLHHNDSLGIIETTYNSSASFTPLTFKLGNAERMRIDTSGNVGIGTSSPADVRLSLFSGGSGTAGQLKLGYDNSNMFQIGRLDPVGTGSGNFQIKPNGGTSVFDITSTGRVGIGTPSPTNKLHVKGTGAEQINLETSGGATTIVAIALKNSANTWQIENGRASNVLSVRASSYGETIRSHANGVTAFNAGIALGVGLNNTATNVLDDYEEGTFTAQISTDSTYFGDSAQLGVYTKIGDMCFFQIRFQRTGTLNSGSNARFGLPFTSANNAVQASGFRGSVENIDTSMVGIGGTVASNSAILFLNEMTSAVSGHNVNGNDLGANFQVQIQGFYKTA